MFCHSVSTAWTIVNGRVVADHGELTLIDQGPMVERHNKLARQLAGI
jgi:hypothetical protein